MGPLGYLAVRSTRNRLFRQLRRLRTPRYAIALVLGLAYLWAVAAQRRPSSAPTQVSAETVELLAAVGVTAVLLWTWIFGADGRALGGRNGIGGATFAPSLTRSVRSRPSLPMA